MKPYPAAYWRTAGTTGHCEHVHQSNGTALKCLRRSLGHSWATRIERVERGHVVFVEALFLEAPGTVWIG